MSSVNKVTLIGNLGKDPEIKTFGNGNRVAQLRLATTETWRDKAGERREKTEWHTVIVSVEPLIKFIESRFKKGHKVYIEGKLETRNYESNDGSKKKIYVTEVTVRPFAGEVKLLERAAANSNRQAEDGQDGGYESQDQGGQSQPQSGGRNVGLEDDIPF